MKNEQDRDLTITSQSRIASMSLVHEMLYKNDDVGLIVLRQYLEQLLAQLEVTYSKKSTQITVDCGPIELSLDQSIPLGLLINELVTNSYKHAFTATSEDQEILIRVKTTKTADNKSKRLHIDCRDNGTGFNTKASSYQGGLGAKLVTSLCEELSAQVIHQEDTATYNIQFLIK
jgi:two-component sensor histidine kinase